MDPPTDVKRERFRYQPLPDYQRFIRLITIAPTLSPDEGLIQCSMSQTKLTGARYECLSYRWGKPGPGKLVLIDGKYAYIQENLFEFLDTVRATYRETIWIDALCINQDDSTEKGHQVTQMGDIYSEASRVCVWLGRPLKQQTGCHNLLECLRQKEYDPTKDVDILVWLMKYFFFNEYWWRCWIIQEIVLARHVVVMLGSDTSDLSQLIEAAFQPQWSADRYSQLFHLARLSHGRSHFIGKGLLSLLADFPTTRSTLLHDRIFALVPLCREKAIVEVDYAMSISQLTYKTMEVCKESLCVCSAIVVLQVLGKSSYIRGHYLEIDLGQLWFSFGEKRYLVDLGNSSSQRRIANITHITSVAQHLPRFTCPVLTHLLDHIFIGAYAMRIHQSLPLNGVNYITEDRLLSGLQSTTAELHFNSSDQPDHLTHWDGIEDERRYILTNTSTIRSTSTGHLVCVSSSELHTFLEKLLHNKHPRFPGSTEPLYHIPLCERGMGQFQDPIGYSAPICLRQGSLEVSHREQCMCHRAPPPVYRRPLKPAIVIGWEYSNVDIERHNPVASVAINEVSK